MTDQFPDCDLGQSVSEVYRLSFKCESAVAKGACVKMDTHTAGEVGSISTAGAGDKPIGVALRAGEAGDFIPVLVAGIVKVTASGSISLGAAVKAAANGKVQAAVNTVTIPSGGTTVTSTSAQPSMTVESGIAFGVALQTFANNDTGLVAVDGMR